MSLAAALVAAAIHLQPALTVGQATQLAASLIHWSPDPWVSLAIGFQESGLRADAVGTGGDQGLFQIYPSTARAFHLDVNALAGGWWAIDYQVQAHAQVLRAKLAAGPACARGPEHLTGWTCYHSFTERYRRAYWRAVWRHLQRMKPFET